MTPIEAITQKQLTKEKALKLLMYHLQEQNNILNKDVEEYNLRFEKILNEINKVLALKNE